MQLAPATTAVTEPPQRETITLDVGGMKCAGCAAVVERQLQQQAGVISACVNLATEVAAVECETGVDPEVLAKKLTDSGFPTQPRYGDSLREATATVVERHRQAIRQQIWQLAIALVLILLSGFSHLAGPQMPLMSNIWFHWGLATLALLLPGRPIIVDGWQSWWRNAPNMNALVGLGALTAYTASTVALLFPQLGWECFFDEPVMLLGFILLGKTLEQQARQRAAAALQALIALQPTTARLVPQGFRGDGDSENAQFAISQCVEIPADRVRVGEWLQVLPGEKIPVDGEVWDGKTTVDESMLTGESHLVLKTKGDTVCAGTLNQSGAMIMRATRTGKETTLAQIVALVEAAQTRKAPIQYLADTVAGYFTYGVMAIATLTFLFWYFIGTHIWSEVLLGQVVMPMGHGAMAGMSHLPLSPALLSLKLAIAVLVISCPCALGLATPTAILVGSGIGAERGLLIRGGDVLERVHQLNTVVFDKTGTLTTGLPTIADCLALAEDGNPSFILQAAAAVESGSNHPLAKAIASEAARQDLPVLEARDFHTEPGLGASAEVNGQLVLVGNSEWLRRHGVAVETPPREVVEGKTLVYVAVDGALAGLIACSESLRADAKAAVERLRGMGLRVMLLTGDRAEAAAAIAQELELAPADILAEVRPEGKAQAIAALQAQGYRVAMVGDGINDAPALAQADVGMGMHAGTDVAVETAQIVLMRDALTDVAVAIELGRATFNKIRQNLFWAFAYNSLGIPVAAGALLPSLGIVLSPAAAGAFMAFSSVSVVTNSLLLRRRFSS